MRRLILLMSLLGLSACVTTTPAVTQPEAPPVMRWDFRPDSQVWTDATLDALQSHGAALPAMTPADITEWCPDYPNRSAEDRAAFWAGLFSALAKHESTWRPEAVGGGGLWFGLVQIAPATARAYGCAATSGSALKNPVANLSCGVRIAAKQVSRRGSVNRGMRDWGPFHSGAKRAEMSAWTRAQPYCQAQGV
ncbi:Transglycosylase SLT domain protein [Rhodobacteraceae bacterium THAF1]|uniref:transglycosylase SLT domain-containing protein n=1 Tax=Palleronia sp. THAF1 TaxID=2587842 RepID=UPI000F4100AA|nr:transglycosylase SLT domain-containing protein [Palleronia sp. THAF1]QFU09249.1 Transglycosylase SLT domain protein [Palleronia sp. THAF1]VDC27375.1 Transglycosylase SLT domain protein [Rhodobacteraceae bacterium THAF1]